MSETETVETTIGATVDDGASGPPEPSADLDTSGPEAIQQAIAAVKAKVGAPPAKPSRARRAAPVVEESAKEEEAGEEEGQPEQPQPQQAASAPSEDQTRLLRVWGLPAPRPGETREQVWARLDQHDRSRTAVRHERDALKAQMQSIKGLEPLLRQFFEERYKAQEAAQREQAMAALPDPEVQPEQYNRVMLEAIARQLAERDQAEKAAREQEAQLNDLVDYDDESIAELEGAIQADPELGKAYAFWTQLGYRGVQRMYPDASPADIQEFVQNAQILEMRQHRQRGMSVSDVIRQGGQDALELAQSVFGLTPAQAAQMASQAQASPANGNGKPKGSANAQRLERDHAQAQARRAVSGPAGRGSAPSGEAGIDLTKLDAEQATRLALEGKLTPEMIQAQLAIPARRGYGA